MGRNSKETTQLIIKEDSLLVLWGEKFLSTDLGRSFNKKVIIPVPVEEIARSIGLKPDYQKRHEGYSVGSLNKEDGTITFEDPTNKLECRMTIAHEIGECVRAFYLAEGVSEEELEKFQSRYQPHQYTPMEHRHSPAEYFSEMFAQSLLCPRILFERGEYEETVKRFLRIFSGKNESILNTKSFKALCEKLLINYDTLIRQLDGTRLLSDLGVIILCYNYYYSPRVKNVLYQALPRYLRPPEEGRLESIDHYLDKRVIDTINSSLVYSSLVPVKDRSFVFKALIYAAKENYYDYTLFFDYPNRDSPLKQEIGRNPRLLRLRNRKGREATFNKIYVEAFNGSWYSKKGEFFGSSPGNHPDKIIIIQLKPSSDE